MPPARVDLDRLRQLGAAIGPLGECARDGADEVLAQFPDVGDRETQADLDRWVDSLAHLLCEVDAVATDLSAEVRILAVQGDRDRARDASDSFRGVPRWSS